MPTTTAQARANQRNALRSTGPRTEAGKARSRLNALDHGLRAEQVVLPGEDPAAFRAEVAAWFDDWKPTTHTRAVLVERAAVAAWRLRRCVRVETTRLRNLGRAAVRLHESEAQGRVVAWIGLLATDPPSATAALMNEREGVDALLGRWGSLAEVLDAPEVWDLASHRLLQSLMGTHPDVDPREAGPLAVASWRLLMWADAAIGSGSRDDFDVPGDPEAEAIIEILLGYVAERSHGLRVYLGDYFADPATFATLTADAASVDASREGTLLLRYEATHDRSLRATVGLLMQLARTGLDLVDEPGSAAEIEPIPAPADAAAPIEPIGPNVQDDNDLSTSPPPDPDDPPSPVTAAALAITARPRDREGRAQIWGPADPEPCEMSA